MSNRTLFEFNHDMADKIEHNPEEFVRAMIYYLNSALAGHASALTKYGITRLGIRHHSEPFDVTWGAFKAIQK